MNATGHDALALITEHTKNFLPPPDALYLLAYLQWKDRVRTEALQHYDNAVKEKLAMQTAAFSILALEIDQVLTGTRRSLYDRLTQRNKP